MSTRQRLTIWRFSQGWLIFLFVGLGCGLGSMSAAQTPAAGEAGVSHDSGQLQAIVITAEKRSSTVQQTALSITAVSGEQLAAQGLSTIRDVAAQVPGIEMRTSGPGQTEYEMRGLSSSGGSSATVGLYLNDVPLSAPAAALNGKVTIDPDLFDLTRVEVLRGPQGTLYGAGSMGGTIRLITTPAQLGKLESEVEVSPSYTWNGGLNWGGNAMLNLPIIQDRLAVRLIGTDKFTQGWIDRDTISPFPIGPGGACGFNSCTRGDVQSAPIVTRKTESNWERLSGGRVALQFRATDALTADVLGMYQKLAMGAPSQVDVPPGVDSLTHYQPFNISEPYEDTFRVFSLDLNLDLGFATLTSATSRWSRESTFTGDEAESYQNLISTYYGLPDLLPVTQTERDSSDQTSEELRLTSSGHKQLEWVGGLYYSSFESIYDSYGANPAYADISFGGPSANPNGIAYIAHNPYRIKQYAAFAESSYQFENGLKPTLGVRYYKYDTSLNFAQSGLYSETGNASVYAGTVSSRSSGVNPKINVAYLPNDHLTLYTQAARGFRPGGVNLPVPVPPCAQQAPLSYGPDYLWNYEAGEKARLAGGRVTLNADYYYIIWNNIQQVLVPACGFPTTQNSGKAISRGPELELTAKVTDSLSVSINGTYTDAKIRDVSPSVAGQLIAVGSPIAPGMPLENIPSYSASEALNYSMPITEKFQLTARLSATETGPYHDISYYFERLPGYTITSARFGLIGDSLEAFLFVDNVANKHAITTINTTQFSVSIPTYVRAAVTTPRTIGIDFQYHFQ